MSVVWIMFGWVCLLLFYLSLYGKYAMRVCFLVIFIVSALFLVLAAGCSALCRRSVLRVLLFSVF